jgi:hypothetical protein
MAGATSGKLMRKFVCHGFAPSICADSSKAASTELRAL